uniref:Uncharacterized protein n=1 Tax=Megaselia scalaris TaxID=36166 RepID=T1GF24_MEGSC
MASQNQFEASQTRPKQFYFNQSVNRESYSSIYLSSKRAWYNNNTCDIIENGKYEHEFGKPEYGSRSENLPRSSVRNGNTGDRRDTTISRNQIKFNRVSSDAICSLFAKRAENCPDSEGFQQLVVQPLYRKFSRGNPRSFSQFRHRARAVEDYKRELSAGRKQFGGVKHVCGRNRRHGRVSFS